MNGNPQDCPSFCVFSTIYACETSYCGDFSFDYPFKLSETNPPDSCTYFNLSCNGTDQYETPVLSLPYDGDFNIREIRYPDTVIVLYDPGTCLMGRLMKLNLSSSPFKAVNYQNYTFYTCPYNASVDIQPIECLGNDMSMTIATATNSSDRFIHEGCDILGSWKLPVLEEDQFEDDFSSDLYLKWDYITCSNCDDKGYWARFVRSHYFIPSFIVIVTLLTTLFREMGKLVFGRSRSTPTEDEQPALPVPGTGGLDDSKINSCTELVVISESRIDIGADLNTCSICLESYVARDTVRRIAKCEHCFHAECIQMWLKKSRTCPVCRTVLAHVVEP